MKKNLLTLLSVFAVLFSQELNSQVANYSFTQTMSSYGAANTGSLVGGLLQDDDVTLVGLPFTFTFNGTSYNNINVCSNGYLSFNALSGIEYTAISDNSTQEVIAPFATDLIMATILTGDFTAGSNTVTNLSSTNGFGIGDSLLDLFFDFGGVNPVITGMSGNTIILNIPSSNTNIGADIILMNGSIRQSVSGVAPNRVCEFQFKNLTRFFVYDEVINFKVRLFETSNKIEFIYGPIFVGVDQSASEVGLKGTLTTDFNSRSVTPNIAWVNSVPASLITDACDFTNVNYPQNGLKYVWSTSVCIAPTLTVSQTSNAICAGQSSTITAFGATTYSWSTGSTGGQIVVSPSVTTTYILTGFDGTCSSTISVTQNAGPVPTVNISQSDPVICTGQSATLTGSGATTYSWSNGAVGSQITITPNASQAYTVTGTTGVCTGSSSVLQNVTDCTGLKESLASGKNFIVYPNPSNGSMIIKNESSELNVSVKIYNVLGSVVYSQPFGNNNNEISINTGLPEGVYLLELITGNHKQVKQIIITK